VEGGKREEECGGGGCGRMDWRKERDGRCCGLTDCPFLFISISIRIVELKMDGRGEFGYLGRYGLLCLSFFFLLHHFEVTLGTNYLICANISVIYNSMHKVCHIGVSTILK
jgi:hypothetical protein